MALSTAACGGGGNGQNAAEPTGPQLTKAEFIRRADRVCRVFNDRNSALRSELPRPQGQRQQLTAADRTKAAEVYRRFAANVRGMASRLDGLSPPAPVASQWQDSVDRMDNFADAIDDYANAVKDGDVGALRDAQARASELSIATDPFVTRYGFSVCGGGAGA